MEETKTKVDNKKTNKKKSVLIGLGLTAIIIVCGSFIKSFPLSINEDVHTIIENNEDDILFDDILDLEETIGIENIETGEIEQYQVEDAIEILEEKSNINDKIQKLNLQKYELNELSEEAKENALEFLEENGIDAIIELYRDKNNTKIEKARIAQQLLYIQEINNQWIYSNAVPVSKSILNRLIASGAIDAYGEPFTEEDYKICEFIDNKAIFKKVELNDEISGQKDSIIITPILASEYMNAFNHLQYLETTEEFSEEDKLNIAKKTLSITKKCCNKKLIKKGIFTYTKKINKTPEE